MWITNNKMTKGNFVLSYLSRYIIPEPANMLEANAKLPTGNLRLLCTFRSIIFIKSGFLSQNIGGSVIFNFGKKLLKKTKYWQRNRDVTFSLEVKVYPLIDSPMMLCNQPRWLSRDYTDVKHWLLSYSVDQPPSIFLGAILLGLNKPRL